MKPGWHVCNHCEGSGVCKHKIKSLETIFWILPFPIRASCDTCVMSIGANPTELSLLVRCNTCNGTGYKYLSENGIERTSNEKTNNSKQENG